jgi:hypothetical protein
MNTQAQLAPDFDAVRSFLATLFQNLDFEGRPQDRIPRIRLPTRWPATPQFQVKGRTELQRLGDRASPFLIHLSGLLATRKQAQRSKEEASHPDRRRRLRRSK